MNQNQRQKMSQINLVIFALLTLASTSHANSKVFVFGGWTDASFETNDVEIIDVLSDSRPCLDPTSMPVAREASEAQLMNDNTILVCGGRYRDDCDRYDIQDDLWLPDSIMNTPRYDAQSVFQRDRNIFEMIGGRSDDVTYLDSVESNINDNGWTVSQLRLPNGGMHHHCIVQLNDHRAFLAGGLKSADEATAEAYILDMETSQWIQVASMSKARSGMGCGYVRNSGGGVEVVVQEGTETEIFNFESMSWRAGPPMFENIQYAGSGQLDDTFVIVGGNSGPGTPATAHITRFDNINYEWVQLSQTLSEAKMGVEVLSVPDGILGSLGC